MLLANWNEVLFFVMALANVLLILKNLVQKLIQMLRSNMYINQWLSFLFQMYKEFMTALDEAGKNDACVVAMVTGTGDYYCSGNDLSNFARIPPEGPQKMARDGRDVLK